MIMTERKQVYKDLFLSPCGEKVLEDLKSQCYLDQSTFNTDVRVEDAIYKEGKRSILLYILKLIV